MELPATERRARSGRRSRHRGRAQLSSRRVALTGSRRQQGGHFVGPKLCRRRNRYLEDDARGDENAVHDARALNVNLDSAAQVRRRAVDDRAVGIDGLPPHPEAGGELKLPTVPISVKDTGPPVPGTWRILSCEACRTPPAITPATSTLTPLPTELAGPPLTFAVEAFTGTFSTRSEPSFFSENILLVRRVGQLKSRGGRSPVRMAELAWKLAASNGRGAWWVSRMWLKIPATTIQAKAGTA